MAGAMVNIPRDVDDPHYRYKMPVLRAKVRLAAVINNYYSI